MRSIAVIAAILLSTTVTTGQVIAQDSHHGERQLSASSSSWITLGTVGGPRSDGARNQPANLLLVGDAAHLVDVGDGATTSMTRAGVAYAEVKTVWISHIHFDHIGGLYALLGLRLQTRTETALTVYGPPGMRDIVTGLISAMMPSARSGFGVPGETMIDPAASITVVEIDDGAVVDLGDVTVRAVANTHYSFVPGSAEEQYYRSLSFRFDMADRSIIYSGDTGPSQALTDLAGGADLLVTEMIDVELTIAGVRQSSRNMPPQVVEQMRHHLSSHHLTTADIGQLAHDAGVGQVVLTHFAGGAELAGLQIARYVAEVKASFDGPVQVASDMAQF